MEGIALDSGVCIRAERLRMSMGSFLTALVNMNVGDQIALTAIGVTELVHGIYRADSLARSQARRVFVETLLLHIPVLDYTHGVAQLVGRIGAEQTAFGTRSLRST
jgi:predicted nucleic acid-binding protein